MAKETRETIEKAKLSSTAHNFPIVGIGASAGGLDAFRQLLEAIPLDSEMAYVVVQHLNPAHQSNLTEILSRVTKIPIEEITDDVKILPNHIYVMPSGKILTSVDGVLKLTPRENIKTNLVIDIFFTSLAVVWGSMAVGVILSGTGADGTAGLKKIKEHGGTTIVQDESAAYGDMPQSAVDANVVDFVLPAGKIPAQLLKINNDSTLIQTNEEEELLLQSDEVVYKQILQVLLQHSGVDFSYYKQSTVRRRVGRRMAMHKRGNLADYLKFLRIDKNAQAALFQDMLISVTAFFRDPKIFETLTEKVLPLLLKSKTAEDTIRIWIAGCATGEEVYSIAICLHELIEKKMYHPSGGKSAVQIFASDLSDLAIRKARVGVYTLADVQPVSENRLSKYFTRTAGMYQVNKVIRDMCVFARHNFLKDPPFAKLDLISCRNVLIYMEPILQKKALTTFHYALKENGTLMLGKSETVNTASELFVGLEKRQKIYTRLPGEGRFMQVTSGHREETLTTQNAEAKKEGSQIDFRNDADTILLSRAPAAVVINASLDIVHIHGDIEPFLKNPAGKPSFNLLKMAKEQLAIELRNAIHKVKTSKDSVIKVGIPVPPSYEGGIVGSPSTITIEVFRLTDSAELHYLILFTKIYLPVEEDHFISTKGSKGSSLKRNKELENELAHAREDIISIKEEMEAAIEELQTSNEELQSSIEELQSLNEELETSGEELQSSNEELTIVNQELIDKEHLLNAARDYSEAIVSTIKEPLVVLDRSLCIKSANESFYKKFDITKTETEGKLFYELQNERWDIVELRILLENILPQKNRIEDFEMIMDERILLLNASKMKSEKSIEPLILLSIEDVTDSRLAKQLTISEARLASERLVLYNSFMSAPAGIAILKGNTHIYEFANDTYEKFVGKKIEVGKTVQEHFPELEQQGYIEILNNVFSTGEAFINNEMPITLKSKEEGIEDKYFLNLVLQPLKDELGNTERMLAHVLDVTEAVNARKLIETSELFNRTILESSPDCLKVLDNEGRINFMNLNGLCQMELDDFSTVENTKWSTIWGSENESMVKASLDKAFTGETTQFTALCRTAKGTPKWWDVIVSPVVKPGEPVQQIISVSRDVTEKKKTEEAIEKMASHLKLATDSANVATWSLTLQTQKLEWSALHKKMWGYHEDNTSLNYEDWHKLIVPEDKEHAFKQIEAAKLNQTVYDVTYRIARADDDTIHHIRSVGKYYYDDKGEAETLTGISIDITEHQLAEEKLKESEKQFRIFADSVQSLAWIADANGLFYFFNQQWYDYTGTMPEDMKHGGWKKVHHPDHFKKVEAMIETLWKKNEAFELTYPLRRHDGVYRWFLTRALPVIAANGTIQRWIGTSTDITEQKSFSEALEDKVNERTRELLEKNVQLEYANAELSSFNYIASHDLQEPLRKIQLFSKQIIAQENFSDRTKDYLNRIIAAGERMQNLIISLLDFSLISATAIVFEPSDLNLIVATSMDDLQLIITEKEATIECKNLPTINASQVQLIQVFTNLIDNAIKYSKPNIKPHIEISASLVDGKTIENQSANQERYYAIQIKDNGIGFEQTYSPKIFEIFQRLHGKNEYSGTGIGLAIVKKIVTTHNGFIQAASIPGTGSTFTIYLPAT